MAGPSHQAALPDLSNVERIKIIRDFLNKYPDGQATINTSAVQAELDETRQLMTDLVNELETARQARAPRALSNDELLEIVSVSLKGAGNYNWVLAGASLLGLALTRIVEVKDNDEECRYLFIRLRSFCNDLCVFEMQRRPDDNSQLEKVKKATNLIACGATMCYKYMNRKRPFSFLRMLMPSSTKTELQGLNTYLDHMYNDLEFSKVLELASKVPGPYCQHDINCPKAVGVDEPREAVLKLVDFGRKSVFAVSLFGMGGIGKTTLGDTVYNKLVETGSVQKMNYCKVELELEEGKNNIEKVQTEIFEKLTGRSVGNKIANAENGRHVLKELFQGMNKEGNLVVLMYMDNIPSKRILGKILPQGSCLPNGSRILLTTRLKNVCSDLKDNGLIEDCRQCEVKGLGKESAIKFLCEKSKGRNGREPSRESLEAVEKACCGLPLALQVATGYIKEHADRDLDNACRIVAANMKSGDEEELFRSLVFMIEALDPITSARPSKARTAFIDIVTFDWLRGRDGLSWEEVGLVVGGEDALEVLEERSLVRRDVIDEDRGDSVVWVHDQLLAAGRRLCNPDGKRILLPKTCYYELHSGFQEALKGKDPKQVEGLQLGDGSLPTEELDSLCNLRMLELDDTKIHGRIMLRRTLQLLRLIYDGRTPSNLLDSIRGATGLLVLSMRFTHTTALHDLKAHQG